MINQSNFETAVQSALQRVAEKIEVNNHGIVMTDEPVVRISPHTYQVNIAEKIDVNLLDYYLRNEFSNPFHKIDFVYDVFDKRSNEVVFSKSINVDAAEATNQIGSGLPVFASSLYYFKIDFPERPIVGPILMFVWITAIIILMFVIAFFAYSLNVIFRQRRLSEFQKIFINNLAHELKTPVSTIAISADVLNEDSITEDPERLQAYAGIIKNENERLSHQINKILELAKMENDEIQLNREKFLLDETLGQIAAAFSVKVHEDKGKVVLDLQPGYDIIDADKVHFVNMINTLLDNALKYNDKIPVITIATRYHDKHIYISIKDNGIGIPKEYRKKIFDKFFRVPTGNVHNVKGHGLGLNYVKMLTAAHGWKVDIESEPGKGSVFTLILPYKPTQ